MTCKLCERPGYWHQGDSRLSASWEPNWGPPKNPQTSQQYCSKGVIASRSPILSTAVTLAGASKKKIAEHIMWHLYFMRTKTKYLIIRRVFSTFLHGEIFSVSRNSKPNLNCNYTFPIGLIQNWIVFCEEYFVLSASTA